MEEYNSIDQIRDDIINFKNDLNSQRLKSFYYSQSFSEILRVSRREISHSAFLVWLLDNRESHNFGEFSIKKFLDIVLRGKKQDDEKNELYNLLIIEDYLVRISPDITEVDSVYSLNQFEGIQMSLPRNVQHYPLQENFEWHSKECFVL